MERTVVANISLSLDGRTSGPAGDYDMSWIVPPVSSGLTAVFHRYYDEPDPAQRPAFLPPDGHPQATTT
ncbi:hypothetical protein ACFQ1S_13660 [Kibdelosporangium lantanae]|uniref:Dihydrofolate reductase n=1 Tax=Kibdelosporangium lantanae TaxID=1497396 RepID=A0ABW3MC45_9PSEU